jgi:hypothetical protein
MKPSMSVTPEFIYGVMNFVKVQVAVIWEDAESIKAWLSSIDTRLGVVHTDMALLSDRMDRLEIRMGRVENSLDLSDAE